MNKLTSSNGATRYVRPHEIEVKLAAEFDPQNDRLAEVQHLYSAGPVASLSVRADDGQFIEVEISRKQLDELALSVGDKVALGFPALS